MKKIATGVVVSFLVAVSAFAIEPVAADYGLILWNRLGTAKEVENSEVGDDGILNGGMFVPGPFGNAIELNMRQKYGVTFPASLMTNTVGCLEFWAKLSDFPNSMPFSGAMPGLIGWTRLGAGDGYVLFFSGNDGAANGGVCGRTSMGSSGTGRYGSWTYSNAIGGGNVSEWHHYALTWNADGMTGAAGWPHKVAVFVDGILNSSHGNSTVNNTPFGSNTSDGQIGLLNHQGLVNGRVAFDNIKIWDFAKTDFSDRFDEAAGASPTLPEEDDLDAGLQLYYPFSSNDVAAAADASGNGHHGAISGAQWRDGGPNGGYLSFDGNLDFINAGNAVNFPSWEKYTVSVWFLNDGGGDNSGYGQKLLDKTSALHDCHIKTIPDNHPTAAGVMTYNLSEDGVSTGMGTGEKIRGDNQWHHIVIVRDGANGTCWLDGEMTESIQNMISVNSSSPLYIGYSASPDAFQRKAWSGFIDEVRIYDRAISSDEVSILYQAAVVPPVTHTLIVQGARGVATPANGDYTYAEYNEVSAGSPASVVEGTTRYLCAGATVEGNAFTQVSTNKVTLSITNDTTVTWNWVKQYKLTVVVDGGGSVSPGIDWLDEGSEVLLTATPGRGSAFVGWEGETSGCTVNGSEISVSMNQPRSVRAVFSSSSPLIGHYKLDGNALDSSLYGFDGIVYSATPSDEGVDGGCYDFNGATTAIVVQDPAAENRFPQGSPITISAWVKARGFGNGNTTIAAMDSGRHIQTRASLRLGAEGNFYYFARTVDGIKTFTGPKLETGLWYHITATHDAADVKLYVDGIKVAETNNFTGLIYPFPPATFNFGSLPFQDKSVSFSIGSWTDYWGFPGVVFNGLIDDVRFYNCSLNDAEVAALFDELAFYPVLTVAGAMGAAVPGNGEHPLITRSAISACVSTPIVDGHRRFLSLGASVAGNDYTMNGVTNVTMNITNHTTLTWNWLTQYKLETAVIGSGEVTLAEMWQDAGAVVQLTASPASEWVFSGWDGDLEGCVLDGATISVPMNQPRLVRATFVPLVVMAIKDYAKRPGNAPLKYRGTPKAWFYSNEVGGLYCNSPLPNRSSTMQLTAKGPGVLSFEWEFPGADGASTLTCSVGTTVRATKQGEIAETASVAIASGSSSTVRWKLRRAANSAEVGAVIRDIVWTPLAQPSLPVPADGSVLLERDFAGVSWTGSAERYRVYAGTSKSLQRIGTEEYNENSAPAAAFEAAMAQANGDPLFWRVDAVAVDSFGTEIVNRGALWSLTLLPDGSPEFESSLPHISAGLKRGVFSEVGPLSFANGFEGDPQCRIIAGRLPAGMRLAVRDNAVYIAGVPTRAGQYASTLQLSVKTSGRISRQGTTRGVDLTVSDLGEVIGKYDGWLSDSIYGEGPVSLTVSAAGRISGKFTLNGVAHTLRASAFDRVTNGWCVVSTEVTSRSKGSFPVTFAVSEKGWVEAFCNDDSQALLALVRNRWREAGSREILAAHAGDYHLGLPASVAYPEGGGLISISISERNKGRILIKGTMPNGKRFPITAALMHLRGTDTEPARVMVVISAKPSSATGGQGLFGVQEIVTDPDRVEPNAILDLLPLRWW